MSGPLTIMADADTSLWIDDSMPGRGWMWRWRVKAVALARVLSYMPFNKLLGVVLRIFNRKFKGKNLPPLALADI
jgi:hypothetical protein